MSERKIHLVMCCVVNFRIQPFIKTKQQQQQKKTHRNRWVVHHQQKKTYFCGIYIFIKFQLQDCHLKSPVIFRRATTLSPWRLTCKLDLIYSRILGRRQCLDPDVDHQEMLWSALQRLKIYAFSFKSDFFLQSDWMKKSKRLHKKGSQSTEAVHLEGRKIVANCSLLSKWLFYQCVCNGSMLSILLFFSDILNSVVKSNFSRAAMIVNCLHNISTYCLVSKVLTLLQRKWFAYLLYMKWCAKWLQYRDIWEPFHPWWMGSLVKRKAEGQSSIPKGKMQ